MTRPPNTYARVTDAVDRLDVYARDRVYVTPAGGGPVAAADGDLLALRHLCEALDRVMRNNPVLAEVLEKDVADACDAVGVEGP